jgi:hypothetical protein
MPLCFLLGRDGASELKGLQNLQVVGAIPTRPSNEPDAIGYHFGLKLQLQ